ncbi:MULTISPECIES: hypothetical protein [unclassified Rhizobium]|uniref:hypothetical protein n=1 Tax=unclassified Rhizobium TaxID=2613769 RepID=UPI001617FDFF|nr:MULTISPECIES: hypothetical protein [unclassified Rhizobium]MBB3385518.1 hypothetical protein [Rhizobium sp. BK098]MBB3617223.1 hypothetical protein [Rhizobium sp. BK609]MBB3682941.1 hypothetical protein [Rhizobium sp. BK612]
MNLSRRQSFGFLAGSILSTTAVAGAPTLVAAATKMTARERYAYHLAEMKKAAEDIDPMIGHWHITGLDPDEQRCALVITAHRLTGRYEGDGRYEGASPSWNGTHQRYDVKLMDCRIDDERVFHVSTPMERMLLIEPRFNTFIGRKLGGML